MVDPEINALGFGQRATIFCFPTRKSWSVGVPLTGKGNPWRRFWGRLGHRRVGRSWEEWLVSRRGGGKENGWVLTDGRVGWPGWAW